MPIKKKYPDISDILAQKARGRRQRARLSFGEKLEVLDRMRENIAPIVEHRRTQGQRPMAARHGNKK
jgi:hypothetical protein